MNENKELTEKPKKYPRVTTEITLFLFSLALFTTLPITNNLILTKVCTEHFKNSTELGNLSLLEFCRNTSNPIVGMNNYVQDQSAKWHIFLNMAYVIPAFFTCMFAGSWSDKFGRKFPLFLPPIGLCITCSLLTLTDLYIETIPWWVVVLAGNSNGLSGGELIVIAGSISYIVSITDPAQRIRRISILQAMIIIPQTLGPLISLPLRNKWGNFAVFLFSVSLTVLTFIYTIFLKPVYSVDKIPFSLKALVDIQHVKDSLNILIRPRPNSGRIYILLAFAGVGIDFFISMGSNSILYPYVKDEPFSWNYGEYVSLISTVAGASGVMMLVVFPVVQSYFGGSDTGIGILVGISNFVYLVTMGFVRTKTTIYIASSISIISGFMSIVLRTIISKLIDSNERGKVFSVAAVLENVAFLIAKTTYNALWPVARKIFRGIPYETSAVVSIITLSIITYLHMQFKKDQKKQEPVELMAVMPVEEKC